MVIPSLELYVFFKNLFADVNFFGFNNISIDCPFSIWMNIFFCMRKQIEGFVICICALIHSSFFRHCECFITNYVNVRGSFFSFIIKRLSHLRWKEKEKFPFLFKYDRPKKNIKKHNILSFAFTDKENKKTMFCLRFSNGKFAFRYVHISLMIILLH